MFRLFRAFLLFTAFGIFAMSPASAQTFNIPLSQGVIDKIEAAITSGLTSEDSCCVDFIEYVDRRPMTAGTYLIGLEPLETMHVIQARLGVLSLSDSNRTCSRFAVSRIYSSKVQSDNTQTFWCRTKPVQGRIILREPTYALSVGNVTIQPTQMGTCADHAHEMRTDLSTAERLQLCP